MNTGPDWGFKLNLNKNWVLRLGFNPRSYKIIVYYFVCHNFLFYYNFPFLFSTTILPMYVYQELAKILADHWEAVEKTYIQNGKFVFRKVRDERENIYRYFFQIRSALLFTCVHFVQ